VRRRLWSQVIILIALGLGVSITFTFVVFPLLVRITGEYNSRRNIITENRPNPQAPILFITETHVNQSRLEVTGFATPESTLQLVHDGSDASTVIVDSQGGFRVGVNLREGRNIISAYVIDTDGLESNSSRYFTVYLDTVSPELFFNEEPPVSVIGRNNRNLEIIGHTKPGSRIYINERMGRIDSEGNFVLTFHLNEGINDLIIEVVDRAGNYESVDFSVNFEL
jgi:bacillopeptidase F